MIFKLWIELSRNIFEIRFTNEVILVTQYLTKQQKFLHSNYY